MTIPLTLPIYPSLGALQHTDQVTPFVVVACCRADGIHPDASDKTHFVTRIGRSVRLQPDPRRDSAQLIW